MFGGFESQKGVFNFAALYNAAAKVEVGVVNFQSGCEFGFKVDKFRWFPLVGWGKVWFYRLRHVPWREARWRRCWILFGGGTRRRRRRRTCHRRCPPGRPRVQGFLGHGGHCRMILRLAAASAMSCRRTEFLLMKRVRWTRGIWSRRGEGVVLRARGWRRM